MANIRENKKNGKVISFRFTVCLERDVRGKQIRKYTTWTAPADLTPAKARKAAERAADAWEEEVKVEYQKQKDLGSAYRLPPDKRRDDFVSFVNDTWFVLQIRGENDKPNTIAFYKNMTRIISEYFKGSVLQEISPVDIQKYLVYLRTEYKSKLGKPLSAKTLRHQYGTLNLIFGYAEQQEMLLVWGAAMLGTFLLDLCLWGISYPDKRRWGDSLSQAHFYKWQSTKQFYTRRYIMRTSIRNILSAIIIMSVLLCNAMAIEKENIKINSAAEELIVDFLDAYSTSLVELTPLDYSDFFWDTESTTVFALLTDYRIEYDSLWDSRYSNISIDPEFSNISAVDDEIVADVKLSYEANIWHDGKSEKTLGVIDFTFTLKASDDNWKISAITREGDEEWIEDAKTSSAKKTGTTVVSELKRLLNEELAKAKALPHTKMLYGTPIDPKETQVLNTSVEDTKASSMRNALIVAYDANKAVNYSDCYALTENSLFYEADKDCTNFVSQCVWAGYGGWVNGDETANAQNIAAHYRMYHHNNSDWYTTSWFAHKNGGSSPWESATSHGNFALGNTGSGLGPFGLGSTTAVLYSNYDASSIQRGDVVQLGRSANDIRHSVIVRTAGSSFENIFVNSHNSKHYNYPLSKYFETYSYIRVIHYRPAFFAN